jgi:uncharacterized protein (TIGR02266 family)
MADENPREQLVIELRVCYGPNENLNLYGFSVDMSDGGLFLKTEFPFAVDEKLLLSFTLPEENKTVTCRAKIAWLNQKDKPKKPQHPQGIGVQFVDLSGDSLESIQNLLRHHRVEARY